MKDKKYANSVLPEKNLIATNDIKDARLVSYGCLVLPPVIPGSDIENLCKWIDVFYANYPCQHKKQKASDLIRGAFYAMRPECRSNTDWMSQAASSARDVLYPLISEQVSTDNLIKLFKWCSTQSTVKCGDENKKFISVFNALDKIYKRLSDITHHGTSIRGFDTDGEYIKFSESDFEDLMRDFVFVFQKAFSLQQVYIHSAINIITQKKKKNEQAVDQILKINTDACRYFYATIDERWLSWLWERGHLDLFKIKNHNTIRNRPEFDYVRKVATKVPHVILKIISDKNLATTKKNFNSDVVDLCLSIIHLLPVIQLKKILPIIRRKNWLSLMQPLSWFGYDFGGIVKKLVGVNEDRVIIDLAKTILVVKIKSKVGTQFGFISPFYVDDLTASGIFNALVNINDSFKYNALKTTICTLKDIIILEEQTDSGPFKYADLFALYDADIFTLENGEVRSYSSKEDVISLVVTIKSLIESIIKINSNDLEKLNKLFDSIDNLPTCRLSWRLKLFTLAQCPEAYKNEIKKALFILFDDANYYEIVTTIEYKKALRAVFASLSSTDQREYVKKVIELFFRKAADETDKQWIKKIGLEIISSIPNNLLTREEREECEKKLGAKPDRNYIPDSTPKIERGGFVNYRSPVELDNFTIDEIVSNLKTKWTEKRLSQQYKEDDFLNPRGVEGLGDALRIDFKKRTQDYLDKIDNFFDREDVHSYYLYSLLRGMEQMQQEGQITDTDQINQILELFNDIKNSGKSSPFKKKGERSWLADWVDVHALMAEIVINILNNDELKDFIIGKRGQIIDLIAYLLSIKDSPNNEQGKPDSSDLYHVAINSVRGRAFEALATFTAEDGKVLNEDVQTIYKDTLNDDSLAVRFVIGRYLATFYFRDKNFIINLLSVIFPYKDDTKRDAYFAAWEGYLSNTLFDELFNKLRDYYTYAVSLTPADYPQRKYVKGLDESLAIHLALAFVHFSFDVNDSLFIKFWEVKNPTRHQEFISFIGRSYITRDQASKEWLKINKISEEKIANFWKHAIKNDMGIEPEAFAGFGFWINPDKEILDDNKVIDYLDQTLKISGGAIDWDYGFLRRLPHFAGINGEKTLEIMWKYLLDTDNNINNNRRQFLVCPDEVKNALKIIYNSRNDQNKERVTSLINILVEKGSNLYWGLIDIVSK